MKYKKAFSGYPGRGGWTWSGPQKVTADQCPEYEDKLMSYGLKGHDRLFIPGAPKSGNVQIPVIVDRTEKSPGRDLINAQTTYFNPNMFPATRKIMYKYIDYYRTKDGKTEKY